MVFSSWARVSTRGVIIPLECAPVPLNRARIRMSEVLELCLGSHTNVKSSSEHCRRSQPQVSARFRPTDSRHFYSVSNTLFSYKKYYNCGNCCAVVVDELTSDRSARSTCYCELSYCPLRLCARRLEVRVALRLDRRRRRFRSRTRSMSTACARHSFRRIYRLFDIVLSCGTVQTSLIPIF